MAELHIILQPEPKRKQLWRSIVLILVVVALIGNVALVMEGIEVAIILLLQMMVLIGIAVYRMYYLKSLYLKIGAPGISWRLVADFEFQQRPRPRISTGNHGWLHITGLRHEAAGIRFASDESDEYVPLREFNYVQRQEIKAALREWYSESEADVAVEDSASA